MFKMTEVFKVPRYLICAFEYADYSGLSDEAENMVRDFIIKHGRDDVGMYFQWMGEDDGLCSDEFGGHYAEYTNMTIGYNIEP